MSMVKTTLLLTLLTLILVAFGGFFGGRQGVIIAFVFAVVLNFGSYWFSSSIVLRTSRARPAGEAEYPQLHRIVRRLTQRAGLPMPDLYIIPTPVPNAFATGRNPQHAAVAVTEGLLQLLDEDELEGVIAHELGHVKNRDILISSIAATIAGAIMLLASMARWGAIFGGFGGDRDRGNNIFGLLAMAILAPIAALMVQMAISRTREFKADATGADFAGHPQGLASALRRLEQENQRVPAQASPASPATAHMYIVKPFAGGLGNLFSTHPPMQERIDRLMKRAGPLVS
jgi:heat shock protein HtpX